MSADIPGAPEARAQELIDVTTSAIFTHMSNILTADHRELLALLLALERLQATRKLTNEEMSLWMGDTVSEVVQSRVQTVDDVGPCWLSREVVCPCLSLTVLLHCSTFIHTCIRDHDLDGGSLV